MSRAKDVGSAGFGLAVKRASSCGADEEEGMVVDLRTREHENTRTRGHEDTVCCVLICRIKAGLASIGFGSHAYVNAKTRRMVKNENATIYGTKLG